LDAKALKKARSLKALDTSFGRQERHYIVS
jgi:hypothetical protein